MSRSPYTCRDLGYLKSWGNGERGSKCPWRKHTGLQFGCSLIDSTNTNLFKRDCKFHHEFQELDVPFPMIHDILSITLLRAQQRYAPGHFLLPDTEKLLSLSINHSKSPLPVSYDLASISSPPSHTHPSYFPPAIVNLSTKFTTTAANSAIVKIVGPNRSSKPPCPRILILLARQWNVNSA